MRLILYLLNSSQLTLRSALLLLLDGSPVLGLQSCFGLHEGARCTCICVRSMADKLEHSLEPRAAGWMLEG